MGCCGKKTVLPSNKPTINIPYVDAIYWSPQSLGETSLYSRKHVDQTTKRRLLIAEGVMHGDKLSVPVADVLLQPELFRATCGEPFVFRGDSVIDPCDGYIETIQTGVENETDKGLEEFLMPKPVLIEEIEATLEEMFGKMVREEVIRKIGYITIDTILAMPEDEIRLFLSDRSSKTILRRREKINETKNLKPVGNLKQPKMGQPPLARDEKITI